MQIIFELNFEHVKLHQRSLKFNQVFCLSPVHSRKGWGSDGCDCDTDEYEPTCSGPESGMFIHGR